MKKIKIGLLPRIIIAIILGIAIGTVFPAPLVRIFVTFNGIFSEFLNFSIPLIIVGLVTVAIADIGKGAGKMLFHHFAGKVECARSIQHVDAAALIVDRRHSGGQRDVTLDLFGIIITNGIAVRDSAHTVDGAGHKQQALCQRSLTAAAVTQQADVTDVLY